MSPKRFIPIYAYPRARRRIHYNISKPAPVRRSKSGIFRRFLPDLCIRGGRGFFLLVCFSFLFRF